MKVLEELKKPIIDTGKYNNIATSSYISSVALSDFAVFVILKMYDFRSPLIKTLGWIVKTSTFYESYNVFIGLVINVRNSYIIY